MKILHIIRGLPGSGKTTIACSIVPDGNRLEADFFHIRNEKYDFDRNNLGKAHDWCKLELERKMRSSITPLSVSNTFITNKEIKPYLDLAKQYGYIVQIITIENIVFKSEHNVPKNIIEKMKNNWESYFEEVE